MKLRGPMWLVPAVLLFTLSQLAGQEPRGTLLGRVTDPNNAVIVGANVDAVHVETGVHYTSKTNGSGDYIFPLMIPGAYTITVETAGFKKYTRTGIVLRINDKTSVDVPMELGTASQNVEVTAELPLLDTSTASIGRVLDNNTILDLPLMGGMVLTLATLAPGMTFTPETAGYVRPFDTTSPSTMTADGSASGSNQFMVDGAPNMQRGEVAYSPPPGVVEEVKVQSASFDASTGFMSGAVVNMSLKSGTNAVHGQVYYFMQNPLLAANKFFRLAAGKPQFRMYRWGGSATAPLVIPKIYNGHNKTFVMYGYEGIWSFDPSPWVVESVPTAAQRNGDFSGLLALGSKYQIYDPYSIALAPNGRTSRIPVPGNIIPPSLINPISKKIAALWDLPNQAGTVDGTNNYTMGKKAQDTYWNHIFRIDHNLSSKQRFYVRADITDLQRPENVRQNKADGDTFYRYNRGVGLDHVYVLSSGLVINTRYNLTRFITGYLPMQFGWDLAGLGFSSHYIDEINQVDPRGLKLPQISVSGLSGLGGINSRNERTDNTHELSVNVMSLAGAHTLRYGVAYRVYQDNNYDLGNSSGSISFDASWTRGPLDNSTSAPMGQGLAGFLYGLPSSGSFPIASNVAQQSTTLASFVQDDWKLSRKLTLSIGLRHELESPTTERYNRSVEGFLPDAVQPIQAAVLANYAAKPIPEVPVSQFKVVGGLTFAGVNGAPRALWQGSKKHFMPRLGVAYSLTPKTVLRSGYAIFYQPLGVMAIQPNQTGWSRSTSLTATTDQGLHFIAPFADPFPNGFLQPYGAALGIQTNLGSSISFFNPHMTNPYTQRWEFAVQRQLVANSVLEVGYVGSKSVKLQVGRSLTSTPAQYLSTKPTRDQPVIDYLSAAVSNPYYPLLPGTSLASATVSRSSLLRDYTEFTGVSTNDNVGSSWYHALQINLEKRFSQGLNATLSYTWSKNMTATGYLNNWLVDQGRLERVISSADRTNRLAVNWSYDLPFGQGKFFGRSLHNKVLSTVISGWQVNGIYTAQSGAPLGFGNMIFNGDLKNIPLPKDQRTVDEWFNINAGFERDTTKQLGSNIRTMPSLFTGIRADGANNWDMSAIKNTKVGEKTQIQFRAESMNALNHPQFTAPSTSVTSTAFGTVTGEFAWPRVVQFALKVLF